MPRAMGRRNDARGKSPKADAAMAILSEGMAMPGGGEEEISAEVMETPAPGGGEDIVMGAQALLEKWPDKEHPYYKDLEALVMEYSS